MCAQPERPAGAMTWARSPGQTWPITLPDPNCGEVRRLPPWAIVAIPTPPVDGEVDGVPVEPKTGTCARTSGVIESRVTLTQPVIPRGSLIWYQIPSLLFDSSWTVSPALT